MMGRTRCPIAAGIIKKRSQEKDRRHLLTQSFEDLKKILMARSHRSGHHREALKTRRGLIDTALIFIREQEKKMNELKTELAELRSEFVRLKMSLQSPAPPTPARPRVSWFV